MNKNLSLIAKTGAKSALGWTKVAIPGFIISISCFFAALTLYSKASGLGFSGAAHSGPGAIVGLLLIFVYQPLPSILLVVSLGCLFFTFFFAQKYALRTAINHAWEAKLSDWIFDKIEGYVQKIGSTSIVSKSALKAGQIKTLLTKQATTDTTTGKLQKRMIKYVLQRVHLDNLPLDEPNMNIGKVVRTAAENKLNDRIAPSMQPFWIAMGIQPRICSSEKCVRKS